MARLVLYKRNLLLAKQDRKKAKKIEDGKYLQDMNIAGVQDSGVHDGE